MFYQLAIYLLYSLYLVSVFVTYLQNLHLGSQNLHVSINKSDITTVPIQFRSVACPLIKCSLWGLVGNGVPDN